MLAALLADAGEPSPAAGDEDFARRLDMADRLWGNIAEAAHYHGVVALVEPGLARLAGASSHPDARAARRKLAALRARQADAVEAREECVSELLEAFGERGIRIVLLKGAALAHLLYERPQDRPSLDIDVLVDAKNLAHARAGAEALGYEFGDDYESKFTPRMNHLPEAARQQNGFRISLEIHIDALSPTRRGHLTLADLNVPLQPVDRGAGIDGIALGPYDMLRHLAHHTFEPSQRIRLIHLFDLWRYGRLAGDTLTVDGRSDLRHVQAALSMAALVFEDKGRPGGRPTVEGIGVGLAPLSAVAKISGVRNRMRTLLAPSEWWLRGFHGVPETDGLTWTRLCRHPATVARWITQRFLARVLRIVAPNGIRLRIRNEAGNFAHDRR